MAEFAPGLNQVFSLSGSGAPFSQIIDVSLTKGILALSGRPLDALSQLRAAVAHASAHQNFLSPGALENSSLDNSQAQVLLQLIYLQNDRLNVFPVEILFWKASLQHLFLDNNAIRELPSELGELSNLKRLSLENNFLSELPASIGKLHALRKLSVKQNQLARLPSVMMHLHDELEFVSSNNPWHWLFKRIFDAKQSKSFAWVKAHLECLSDVVFEDIERLLLTDSMDKVLHEFLTRTPHDELARYQRAAHRVQSLGARKTGWDDFVSRLFRKNDAIVQTTVEQYEIEFAQAGSPVYLKLFISKEIEKSQSIMPKLPYEFLNTDYLPVTVFPASKGFLTQDGMIFQFSVDNPACEPFRGVMALNVGGLTHYLVIAYRKQRSRREEREKERDAASPRRGRMRRRRRVLSDESSDVDAQLIRRDELNYDSPLSAEHSQRDDLSSGFSSSRTSTPTPTVASNDTLRHTDGTRIDERYVPCKPPTLEIRRNLQPVHSDLPNWINPEHVVGSGGFAFVFCLRRASDDEVFACKCLFPWRATQANLQRYGSEAVYNALFEREIQLLQSLGRIEQATEFMPAFVEEGHFRSQRCFVMEYCPITLEQRVLDLPMSERDLAPVVLQLLHALHFLHSHGIVHCDLKPSNILFSSDGVAKLADMGSAKWGDDAVCNENKLNLYSLSYMSSQQRRSREAVDFRTDMEQLAKTLSRCMTMKVKHKASWALPDGLFNDELIGALYEGRLTAEECHNLVLQNLELAGELDHHESASEDGSTTQEGSGRGGLPTYLRGTSQSDAPFFRESYVHPRERSGEFAYRPIRDVRNYSHSSEFATHQ
jgi:Leucine-rich repeat (LRR) protein